MVLEVLTVRQSLTVVCGGRAAKHFAFTTAGAEKNFKIGHYQLAQSNPRCPHREAFVLLTRQAFEFVGGAGPVGA
jgi:hypothetical protein